MDLSVKLSRNELPYLGDELRPHFLLSHFQMRGPALVAFVGPCEVKTEAMVDWEDRLASDFIRARSMLHFLGEFFGSSLREGVLLQRILVAIARDELEAQTGQRIRREGDDLYWTDSGTEKKLSVSIVTSSPVSQLLHLGINIDATGAPVQAAGLLNLTENDAAGANGRAAGGGSTPGIGDAYSLGERILSRFHEEYRSMEWACAKVRPVV